MEVWLVIAGIVEILGLVCATTAVQYDKDDTKAWLLVLATGINTSIIGGMLIYYLVYIYPVVQLGR